MKTLQDRQMAYKIVSAALAKMEDSEISDMLGKSNRVHSGIGGTAVKLEIDGVKVFAKQLALTDLEMEHPGSTANLFNLPSNYQIGVGSAGFGAWRELHSHMKTTSWVLNDECPNFPMMYGFAIVKKDPKPQMSEGDLDEYCKYWGGSEEIKARMAAIDNAGYSLVVFLEAIEREAGLNPRLDYYLHPQASEGDSSKPDLAMVEEQLETTCEFMKSKGMIHFDAHHANILTDGERVYFGDFGLTTSLDFDLDEEERDFFFKHIDNYNLSESRAGLSQHPKGESGELLPLLPEVVRMSARYQEVGDCYRDFMRSLRADDSKMVSYSAENMQRLHGEVVLRDGYKFLSVPKSSISTKSTYIEKMVGKSLTGSYEI